MINVTLTPAKGKAIKGSAKLDADAQTVTFDFGKPVQPGSYTLAIDYAGIINTQANGLFALDYSDNDGKAKRALFTQFEAPDARRFVPSFDEPSYKATFDLRLEEHTSELQSLMRISYAVCCLKTKK